MARQVWRALKAVGQVISMEAVKHPVRFAVAVTIGDHQHKREQEQALKEAQAPG